MRMMLDSGALFGETPLRDRRLVGLREGKLGEMNTAGAIVCQRWTNKLCIHAEVSGTFRDLSAGSINLPAQQTIVNG